MNLPRQGLIFIILLTIFLAPGCSGGGENPVTPPADNLQIPDASSQSSDRYLWGIWDITFDLETGEHTVVPARDLLAHFNITHMLLPPECGSCFQFSHYYQHSPYFAVIADVTIKNITEFTAYDVRGIVYTSDQGQLLINEDGWTSLFDIPGGEPTNPFRAFAKDEPLRAFAPSAQHTEHFKILNPPPLNQLKFAVDVSWPGNCQEPYLSDNLEQDKLYSDLGASGEVRIDVHDWQNDVSKVVISAPDISGEALAELSLLSGDTWSGDLVNSLGAGPGYYEVRITAESTGSGGLALSVFDTILVSEDGVPINPIEVTPPDLNFSPLKIITKDGYAYIAAGVNGFMIYRMSGPNFWEYVSGFTYPAWEDGEQDDIREIAIYGDYIFVPTDEDGVIIYDISNPEQVDQVVVVHGRTVSIEFCEGYAIFGLNDRLRVFDIDPIESMFQVSLLETDNYDSLREIEERDGLLYCLYSSGEDGPHIKIMRLRKNRTLEILGMTKVNPGSRFIEVIEGYAYVSDYWDEIQIVDVDPPGYAHVVNAMSIPDGCADMVVNDKVLYLAKGDKELGVYAINDPESPELLQSIALPYYGYNMFVEDDLLTVNLSATGLATLDIANPLSPVLQESVFTPYYCSAVITDGGYAYADASGSMLVIDIDPPESAHIVYRLPNVIISRMVKVGNYIFSAGGNFYVYDISDPANVALVKVIDTWGAWDLAVVGNFAFITRSSSNIISVVDISIPESAHIVDTIFNSNDGGSIASYGEYVYSVLGSEPIERMDIYDVVPIGQAHLVGIANIHGGLVAAGLATNGEYAVLTILGDFNTSFAIIDVNPPDSTYIAKVKSLGGGIFGYAYIGYPALDGEYAYVPSNTNGLSIFDIDPPQDIFILSKVDLPGDGEGVHIEDNYAYIADGRGGLRIIELW